MTFFLNSLWECLLTRQSDLKCIRLGFVRLSPFIENAFGWLRAFKSPYINACRVNCNTHILFLERVRETNRLIVLIANRIGHAKTLFSCKNCFRSKNSLLNSEK